MADDYKKVSIETLNKGAIIDLFDDAWERVMDNVADENCNAESVRNLIITIKIKPSKDRLSAVTTCDVKTKLAQVNPTESFVLFSRRGGSVEAFTTDPRQQDLPMDEAGKIVSMQGGK